MPRTIADFLQLYRLFDGYTRLQPFAQESLQSLITPLIRSLGLQHPKMLEIIGRFPPGSDDLILRVLTVLADGPRLPKNIIELLKTVASRQTLAAPFYPLIIADCDKVSRVYTTTSIRRLTALLLQASILRYLPKIVTLLNNTPEQKSVIRSCFLSVTAPPSQLVGANHPNRTKSDLITAVELMTLLHKSEKEAGLKCTIEGELFSAHFGRPQELTRHSHSRSYLHLLLDARCVSPRSAGGLHATARR